MRLKVGSYNTPHRLAPHRQGMQWLADQGCVIICAQEHTDKDNWSPRGWKRFRPTKAQSNTIYYNPKAVRFKKGGAKRMSSPGFRSLRYITWAHFRTVKGNKAIRVGGIHLPAFKTSSKSSAAEFRKQEPMAASWLDNGPNRVLAGDFNATLPGKNWTPNLSRVGQWSKKVKTGPSGQAIDYVGVPKDGKWKVVATKLGKKFRSDHASVIVTLER